MNPLTIKTTWTHADFDIMGWHDNYIHGLAFDVDEEKWKGDLILDIDYIVEWVCNGAVCKWWIAPSTLTFHDVTDPKICLDWGNSGNQISIHLVSIGAITREVLRDQKICLDRPYYRWRIETNWPSGEITFGATGFTQVLRQPPMLSDSQELAQSQRQACPDPTSRQRAAEGGKGDHTDY